MEIINNETNAAIKINTSEWEKNEIMKLWNLEVFKYILYNIRDCVRK